MKVLLSGFVSGVANKCGDLVASRNHYGLYFRNRVDTPASGSAYWIALRDQSAILAAGWEDLTQTERDAWNTETKRFRKSDVFGQTYFQTGYNFYMGININRWYCGESVLTMPPAPTFVPMVETMSITSTTVPLEKLVYFTPSISSDYMVKLWLTNGMSEGRARAYHEWRLVTLLDETFSSGDDIQALYAPRFDPAESKGNKIFFKAIKISINTGLVSQPLYGSSIIT